MYETLHTDGKTKGASNIPSGAKSLPAQIVRAKSCFWIRPWIRKPRRSSSSSLVRIVGRSWTKEDGTKL